MNAADLTDGAPLDAARLDVEIGRAIDGLDLAPGDEIHVEPVGDTLVIRVEPGGTVLRRVPRWRVADWDQKLLLDLAALQCARLPAEQADRAIAAIHAHDSDVVAPADSSWVFVNVIGEPFMKVHRRDVVVGWPPGVE